MKKDMIVLIVRIFMSLVGLVCLAFCIARPGENQVLLSEALLLIQLHFYCLSYRKRINKIRAIKIKLMSE